MAQRVAKTLVRKKLNGEKVNSVKTSGTPTNVNLQPRRDDGDHHDDHAVHDNNDDYGDDDDECHNVSELQRCRAKLTMV